MAAVGCAADAGAAAGELELQRRPLVLEDCVADGDRSRIGEVAGEVDQVQAGVEECLVACFVGAPLVAAEAQFQIELEPALGGDRVAQLGALEEAAVEGEERQRVEGGKTSRALEVGSGGLLDEGPGAGCGGLGGERHVVIGGGRDDKQVDRIRLQQRGGVDEAGGLVTRLRPKAPTALESIVVRVGEAGDRHPLCRQCRRHVAALRDPAAAGDPDSHQPRSSIR
jgi:hypothetical protein